MEGNFPQSFNFPSAEQWINCWNTDLMMDLFSWLAVAVFTVIICVISLLKFFNRAKPTCIPSGGLEGSKTSERGCVSILYASQSGTAEKFAKSLLDSCKDIAETTIVNVKDLTDPEESLKSQIPSGRLCVFIVSTFTDGKAPASCDWFFSWMADAAVDFRFSKTFLAGLNFSVFGLGHSAYGEENFNKVAKNLSENLVALGATEVMPVRCADDNVAIATEDLETQYKIWSMELMSLLKKSDDSCLCSATSDQVTKSCCRELTAQESTKLSGISNGVRKRKGDGQKTSFKQNGIKLHSTKGNESDAMMDLEDIGAAYSEAKKLLVNGSAEPQEMVTDLIRASLTKQGYQVIGSHSGVKLCRWTKAMLRGRGGCYKHSFYGIASHRCMEATPSLACANKCVFCWRHHSNPVGTEWKWKIDPPEMIVEGAIENHVRMIKMMRGVPGVTPERLEEGFSVQHCALSLVGEPIMYPEINTLVSLLHQRNISTFLVTNAQFPDAIRNLQPVCQLYVSVDASTKGTLKKIDRPLFRDFWERFVDSLTALKLKKQRTVYRLTLVKEFNCEELQQYADLVQLGDPDFIEIKGVTFCGDSKGNLTMENVPWHQEVLRFSQELVNLLPGYELACEHEHSNCVLIAQTKFKIEGRWHTWIDYKKFQQLVERHRLTGAPFDSLDYACITPNWAVIGSDERGFSPAEVRWHRNRKGE